MKLKLFDGELILGCIIIVVAFAGSIVASHNMDVATERRRQQNSEVLRRVIADGVKDALRKEPPQ